MPPEVRLHLPLIYFLTITYTYVITLFTPKHQKINQFLTIGVLSKNGDEITDY